MIQESLCSPDISNKAIEDPVLLHLLNNNMLSKKEISEIYQNATNHKTSTPAALIEYGFCPNLLASAISEILQLKVTDLKNISTSSLNPTDVSDEFIRTHQILPHSTHDNKLFVAIREPNQLNLSKSLQIQAGLDIQVVIAQWHQLSSIIQSYLNQKQFQKTYRSIIDNTDDSEVVKFVTHIIESAIQQLASDIHFEPYKKSLRIRFRIDGVLTQITTLPSEITPRVTARLKVMSALNIAEKRLPQDGRFSFEAQNNKRDCRVSTCPTLFGEKIVVRMLEIENKQPSVDQLGMTEKQSQIFIKETQKPQGLILVTGPTGSGKTVTLYSALGLLNLEEKNISTVEDPVEIQMHGINQVQINQKAKLTFPSILRTFLRQDPDILMIGEIRDKETAEIAIKSAQTGHLVLSTLHTNSAFETLSRLKMLGIEPYNIMDSIKLIVAQRLVRILCKYCKIKSNPPKNLLLNAGFMEMDINTLTLYEPNGCDKCTKGYKGRTGIFELLQFNEKKSTSLSEIQSMPYMKLKASALQKVKTGITSLSETFRVLI